MNAVWKSDKNDDFSRSRMTFLVNAMNKMEAALELIATGERPDGTYNRDRLACQKLAFEVLKAVRVLEFEK